MDAALDLTHAVKATYREILRRPNEAYRPLGVTALQGEILMILGEHGTMTLRELGALSTAESGHPSRLVARMVDAGLVAREPHGTDGRSALLALTDQGHAQLAAVVKVQASLVRELHDAVPEQEMRAASATLRRAAHRGGADVPESDQDNPTASAGHDIGRATRR